MPIKLKNKPWFAVAPDRTNMIDGVRVPWPSLIVEIETDDPGGLPITSVTHNADGDIPPFHFRRNYDKGSQYGSIEVSPRVGSKATLDPEIWRQLRRVPVPVDVGNAEAEGITVTWLDVVPDVEELKAKLAGVVAGPKPPVPPVPDPHPPVDPPDPPVPPSEVLTLPPAPASTGELLEWAEDLTAYLKSKGI